MHHVVRLLLLLSVFTLALWGCKPKAEAPAIAAAAPAASGASEGAADDLPATLMAQVFRGWTAAQPHPASAPSGTEQVAVFVAPLQAVPLDADHRALIVIGSPDDGAGQRDMSHAASVNVGVYGFERRSDRWFRTFERPSLAWTGFNGELGDLKVHALSAGRTAMSIDNDDCRPDSCTHWLRLFALGLDGAQPPTPGIMLTRQAEDMSSRCVAFLDGKPAEAADTSEPVTPRNCFDISGKWQFDATAATGWPDLVLTFTGRQAVQDPATDQLVVRTLGDPWVLRHDGTAYKTLSGRNPMEGL